MFFITHSGQDAPGWCWTGVSW